MGGGYQQDCFAYVFWKVSSKDEALLEQFFIRDSEKAIIWVPRSGVVSIKMRCYHFALLVAISAQQAVSFNKLKDCKCADCSFKTIYLHYLHLHPGSRGTILEIENWGNIFLRGTF